MSNIKKSGRVKGRKKYSHRKFNSRERFYGRNFIFFEIGFIAVGIPVLVAGLLSIPVSMYYAIVKSTHYWPFILVGIFVSFFQILALKFFIKKFYLDPFEMTLGEYLRMRYDERLAKDEDEDSKTKNLTWYDDLDDFIIQIKTSQREQTQNIYARNYDLAENYC